MSMQCVINFLRMRSCISMVKKHILNIFEDIEIIFKKSNDK
jgi:hypothetical protein